MKSVMLAKGGGMATALSLGAGYFLSQHRPRQTLLSPPDAGEPEEGSKTNGGGIKDGVGIMRFEEASPSFTSITMSSSILRYPWFPSEELDCSSSDNEQDSERSGSSINYENNVVTDVMKQEISDLKNLLQSLQDKEAKLEVQLLEFSSLKEQETIVRELENQVKMIDNESRQEITDLKEKETKLEIQILDYSNHREQEIVELKNSIDALVEREARLELQLLNYSNFKEEVAAVKDLENRLKIVDVESQLSAAKTEAMRSENRRLEVELSVHSSSEDHREQEKVRAQLVAAGEKIKRLKKKMRSNSKKAKQKVSTLRKRISALQQKKGEILNHVRSVEGNVSVLKVLEDEAEDLRIENLRLTQENSNLAKKLETESNRTPDSPISESSKINEAMEEISRLRQANDELKKQIEQVRADQSSEIEKAVYLRWINACLRYELRNYRPDTGKIAASDLKYSPSPKSTEKARDLLLQYAYSDDESPIEIDLKYCSSSHSPQHPEIEIEEKHDDDDDDIISITKDDHSTKKPRFLGQLKKLMLGKDLHKLHNNQNSPIDDVLRRISFESTDSSTVINREESRTTHVVGGSRSDSRPLSSFSSKCKRFISTETNTTKSSPEITRSRHRKVAGPPERPQLRTFVGGPKHTSNSVGLLHRPTSFSLC